MASSGIQTRDRRSRFERRRAEILDVASAHINALGVRGMTLTGVARELDLDTSSVTYYFRRKDDLAFACLERTLLWMREQAERAAARPDAHGVIAEFVRSHVGLCRTGESAMRPRLAILSDMHSMASERRAVLASLYAESAALLQTALRIDDRSRALVATLVLLATVHWLPSWIGLYAEEDLTRVEDRLIDLLTGGLAPDAGWSSDAPAPAEPDGGDAHSRFLLAATMLINRDGYHGASVEKIAAELGVSTGSFYHHLENKDDLVLACFDRSFMLIDEARRIGESGGGTHGKQLAATFASLLRLQIEGDSHLLRSSAYQALPPALRAKMLLRTSQMTHHFAGRISDGIAEASVRAVDPMIAGHFFVSAINAAADLRDWTKSGSTAQSSPLFMRILARGLTW